MKRFRYPTRALTGDYLRSAAGLFVGLGVLLAVPPHPAVVVIFGGIALLFTVFGLRTAHRHSLRVAMGEEGIACRAASGTKTIPWGELNGMKLRYFGSRRTKWRPLGSGFMQLTLKGAGTAMTFESSIEGFDEMAGQAAAMLQANGHALDATSTSNLIELGIDPEIPTGGCDSRANVL